MILNHLYLALLVYDIIIKVYAGSDENIDFYVKIIAQIQDVLNKFNHKSAMQSEK